MNDNQQELETLQKMLDRAKQDGATLNAATGKTFELSFYNSEIVSTIAGDKVKETLITYKASCQGLGGPEYFTRRITTFIDSVIQEPQDYTKIDIL